jgi:tetratricopeptide (TPR) repeat protein
MSPSRPADVRAVLARAIGLHQAGDAADAANLYRRLLHQIPNDAEILYLLGSAEIQCGRIEEGVGCLEQSVRVFPKQPETLFDIGLGLHRLGRFAPAVEAYDRALALVPTFAEAHNNRANSLRRLGRTAEALAGFDRALALKPNYADAYCNRASLLVELHRPQEALKDAERAVALAPRLANAHNIRGHALLALNRLEESLAAYERAAALKPDYAEAHNNRGNVLLRMNRPEAALDACERALALMPELAEAHNNRGIALKDLKRFAEALECFDRAIALKDDYAEAYNNRGNVLRELISPEAALESIDRAIALKGDYAAAYSNRGSVLRDLQRPQQALADQDRAVALDPANPQACNNRGNALYDVGRLEEALADLDRALKLRPDYAAACNNRGNVLKDLMRLPEALASFDAAIALDPGYDEARWNKSLVVLLTGDFANGWRLFEKRWTGSVLKFSARKFSQPLWLGDAPLTGKTLLLYGEQGFGDTVQFCRYAPMAAALGAKVILEVPAALLALVSTLRGDFTFVAAGRPLPDFDLQCPMMSLPLAFKTELDTIPADIPYLFADPIRRERWRSRLGPRTRPRIGLVWSGKPGLRPDLTRSMPFRHLLGLSGLPFEYHCLQKEIRETDRAALSDVPQIKTYTDELADFADTAALIAEMDLVISVDTSIAHVAGALGKPVWILLPWAGEWRWLLDRGDSPWYPTAELIRQTRMGDWDGVVADVSARLISAFLSDRGEG